MKAGQFRTVLNDIAWDLQRHTYRTQKSRLQIILLSPGFQAVMVYRLAHWLLPITSNRKGWGFIVAFIVLIVRRFTVIVTGIDLDHRAVIGAGLLIPHPGNIIIGPVVMGRNCEIYQGVTLGVRTTLDPRVPTLRDRVYLAPGAVVLGAITLGSDVSVGPNSVLFHSVPDRTVVLGVPGRVISKKGSFDLVIYPDMESDPDRQRSLASISEARVDPYERADEIVTLSPVSNGDITALEQ